MEFISEVSYNGQILTPFSGQAPSKLCFISIKNLLLFPSILKNDFFSKKKIRVGYVYIEESFDTIFNMGYGGPTGPPPMAYASGKSPMF